MPMMKNNILMGDCLDHLKKLEANSLDSLVTDPPAGISFMGKDWDHHKGGRDAWVNWMTEVMRECFRVMKPGAHGLVWAIPRTSHWMAWSLEDAGFEVRDVVTHLFGSGFPKSLDVSKAIDKAAGAERERTGVKKDPRYNSPATETSGACMGSISPRKNAAKTYENAGWVTLPATEAAKQWQGWGTALKPASEHWILIRKPCSEKTVAKNVLKWGTGAINVDASRVASSGDHKRPFQPTNNSRNILGKQTAFMPSNAEGRFPANLILSGDAPAMLDEQSGVLKSGDRKPTPIQQGSSWKNSSKQTINTFTGDSGGASRFFYCPKASKRDKGADNAHPTVKSTALMNYLIRMITQPGGTVLDPFMGSGSTGVSAVAGGWSFCGIERDPDYFKIAKKRIFSAFPKMEKQVSRKAKD